MKRPVKTLIAEVMVKSKNPKKLPDWGLGRGVLSMQEIDFKDDRGRGFDSPMFAAALLDKEAEMIRDAVRVRWTEKPPKRKPNASKSDTSAFNSGDLIHAMTGGNRIPQKGQLG
jgi:hypothetical protein